jgi:hypothetical protein
MALLNQPTQVAAQLGKFFETLRTGQAPDKVNRAFLKDIGFSSSNHLAFIPLLKGLGLLSQDGAPTQRYRDMLDPTRWQAVLGESLREAYSDIFVLKARPTKADKPMISGKYKSTYNLSEVSADRAASTFLALLELAGEEAFKSGQDAAAKLPPPRDDEEEPEVASQQHRRTRRDPTSLHYNIQIHLPATKDIEVYNAIFRSLRDHIID